MRRTLLRSVYGLAALSMLATALGGCAQKRTAPRQHSPSTLRLAMIGSPATIDPLKVQDASGVSLDDLIYDSLVRISPKLTPEPDIARSWRVSKDGRTLYLHLDPRAKWQDGRPVTPQDVVWSLDAYRDPANASPAAALLGDVVSISALGKDALRVRLRRPDASFLAQAGTLPILPSHLLAPYKAGAALLGAPALGEKAVGSGPFVLSGVHGSTYVLKANRRYFLAKPHVTRLEVTAFSTPRDALVQLRKGAIDLAAVPPADAQAVSTWRGVRLYRSFSLAFAGLVWNVGSPPYSSPVLRRALYFAIDRARIVQGALYGYGAVANGPVPPNSWAYDKGLSARSYDPQRALSILAGLGWHPSGGHLVDKSGQRLTLSILAPSGAHDRTVALGLVARDLTALGITVTVNYEGFAQYARDFASGNFQAAYALRGVSPDPDITAYFGSLTVNAQGLNPGGYADSVVDEGLRAERSATATSQRAAALRDVQEALQVDPPELFLYFPESIVAVSNRFRGYVSNPAANFYDAQHWVVQPAR